MAAVKQCLSFSLFYSNVPFRPLHTDSGDKFGHRNVYLPLQVGTQRRVCTLSGELFLIKNSLGFPHGLGSPGPPECGNANPALGSTVPFLRARGQEAVRGSSGLALDQGPGAGGSNLGTDCVALNKFSQEVKMMS